MKKIISFLLVVSVLSVSLLGCYAQASSVSDPGNRKITEKQAKLYDKSFGVGNWYVDDNGVVHARDESAPNKYTKILDQFLYQCVFPSKIMGQFSDITKYIQAFYQNTKDGDTEINKWFNKYDNSIDIDDSGNVNIKADAMQAFRGSISDELYVLGSYKLFSQNATKSQILDAISALDANGALKFMNMVYQDDCFGFFAHVIHQSDAGEVFVFDSTISEPTFCLVNNNFTSNYYYFYQYNLSSNSMASLKIPYYYRHGTRGSLQEYIVLRSASNITPDQYLINACYAGVPIKIFSSQASALYYYRSLNNPGYDSKSYIVNNYTPSDVTFNINNNYNYENIYNNAYNTINNQKNTTINENGSISEEELQKIIEDAIDAAMKESGVDNSGSGSGGSGGSGGDSGGGISSDLLSAILDYVKKIYAICQTSDSRLEALVNVAQNNQELFSNILGAVRDIRIAIEDLGVPLDNIEKYLKSINDKIDELLGGDDSGGSLFDRILDFLSRLTSDLLADLLGDAIKTIIGDLDSVTGPAKALASTAQSKFPTSIPWDIVAIIGVMSAEPECPKFEIPFSVPRLGIQETIKIDLSDAEKVAELSRNMLTVTFLLFLVIQTRKLYGSMSKN